VTPAVLYLCSEDAPTGLTIHAAGGRFSRSQTYFNKGVTFAPAEATYESLMANIAGAIDMSAATGWHPTDRPRRR
jgi:hypothetical protein